MDRPSEQAGRVCCDQSTLDKETVELQAKRHVGASLASLWCSEETTGRYMRGWGDLGESRGMGLYGAS